MKRRSRSIAFFAALALLFAQALASVHACDGFAPGKSAAAATATSHGADCCDHDTTAPDPACDNHCQQGKQLPERSQTPGVTPAVAMGFAIAVTVALPQSPPVIPASAPDLARGTEPPASIRNCCFRT
jgi:hypothetical protein